jgi:DNA-directed RNA polymerase specialized sigma24 family protein
MSPATESEPTAVGATDVRDLVWAGAGGLNPGDRQVFELMVRHGLSASDVAAVLGISPDPRARPAAAGSRNRR